MRILKILIASVLLASLTIDWSQDEGWGLSYVQAADGQLHFSWSPPTQYTDGAPLLEQDLDFYTLKCDGVEIADIDNIIGTYSYSVPETGFASGDHSCVLTVTTLQGAESGDSNAVNFTIGPRVPMAPAGLTLT